MNHPSNKVTLENVEDLFHYHPPTAVTVPKYEAINASALAFAKAILEHAPDCADRSAAIRWVSLARMTANASIATAPVEPVEG